MPGQRLDRVPLDSPDSGPTRVVQPIRQVGYIATQFPLGDASSTSRLMPFTGYARKEKGQCLGSGYATPTANT
jgi:hypothetical protein